MTRATQTEIGLSVSEIEGMMGGHWRAGKVIQVTPGHFAECLDGDVWKVCDAASERVVGFVNPTNCRSSAELETAIYSVL